MCFGHLTLTLIMLEFLYWKIMGRTWPSKVGSEEMELVSIMRGLFETGKARASHIMGGNGWLFFK